MCRSEEKVHLERDNSTRQQERNNSTRQHERNNSTGETTQLGSRNETTQLVSRNETTQLCTAVDRLQRLQPPAPPLQQNRLFLPTDGEPKSVKRLRSAETRPLTTSNEVAALSTEIQPLVPLPESVPTTSNSEHSNAPEIPQCVKGNSRNRRMRPKIQKAEIKMAPHRPRKSASIEYATDEEDTTTYDVEKEELQPDLNSYLKKIL
ncbi:hypothetical protein TNCV_1615301 [Trichonephila clavipes]|nr:hypothetical protein TNCV_1615301 [Trichonephila clavipes]